MVEIKSYTEALLFAEEHPRSCAPGEVIFEEGQAAGEMYIVREGTIELRKSGKVFETLGPGDVFGEMALIDPAPRSATATAPAGARLVVVDDETFGELVQKVPRFGLELMRLVVRRLRKELSRELGARRPASRPRAAKPPARHRRGAPAGPRKRGR